MTGRGGGSYCLQCQTAFLFLFSFLFVRDGGPRKRAARRFKKRVFGLTRGKQSRSRSQNHALCHGAV